MLIPALAHLLFPIFTLYQSLPTGTWTGTELYPPLPDLTHREVWEKMITEPVEVLRISLR